MMLGKRNKTGKKGNMGVKEQTEKRTERKRK